MRVFSQGSYAGATTAEIAREAGVTEPVLYRHFASKRDLYFACLDEAWTRLKEAFAAVIAEVGPAQAPLAIGRTGLGLRALRVLPPNLWIAGIVEAGEDEEIARHVRAHMREVHDFIADTLRKAQELGAVPAERDPGGRGVDLRRRRPARDDGRPARRAARARGLHPGRDGAVHVALRQAAAGVPAGPVEPLTRSRHGVVSHPRVFSA